MLLRFTEVTVTQFLCQYEMSCRSSNQQVYYLTFLSINGCDPNIFRNEQIACTIPVPAADIAG